MASYYVSSSLEVIFILILLFLKADYSLSKPEPISNKRLCADKECKGVISKAKALATHPSDHPLLLYFKRDDIVLVTSKSAGDNTKLWGGEVKGKKGYFDKGFVREFMVYVAEPQYLVDTEVNTFGKLGKPPPGRREKELGRKPVEPDIGKEEPDQNKDTAGEAKVHIPEPRVPPAKEESESPVLEPTDEKGAEKLPDTKEGNGTKAEVHPNNEGGRPGDESPKDLPESESKRRYEEGGTEKDESEDEEEHQVVNEEDWEELDDDYFETERDRYDTSDFNKFVRKKLSSKESQEKENAPEESSKEASEESSKDEPDESAKEDSEESSKDAPDESAKDAPEESSKDAPEESSKDAPDESSKDAPDESAKEGSEESLENEKPPAETGHENIVPHPLRHKEHRNDKDFTEGSDLSESEDYPGGATDDNLTDENNDDEGNDLQFEPEDKKISFKKSPTLKEADDNDSGGVKMFAMEDEEEDPIGADLPMYDPNSPAAGDSRTGGEKTETGGKSSDPSVLVTAGSSEENPTASLDQGERFAKVEEKGDVPSEKEEEKRDLEVEEKSETDRDDEDLGNQDAEVEDRREISKDGDLGRQDVTEDNRETQEDEADESGKQIHMIDKAKYPRDRSKESKSKTSTSRTESNAEIEAEHSKIEAEHSKLEAEHSKIVKDVADKSDDAEEDKKKEHDLKTVKNLDHILKKSQALGHNDREETSEKPRETVSSESSIGETGRETVSSKSSAGETGRERVSSKSSAGETGHSLSREPKDPPPSDTEFDVRPDTPSGESPEQAQVDDTADVDQDQVRSPKLENTEDGGRKEQPTKPKLNGGFEQSSNHKLASDLPDGPSKEGQEETLEGHSDGYGDPSDPVDLNYFKADEARNVARGGFEGFLQASASEPQQHTDHVSVTPQLESLPTVSESGESVASAGISAHDIHSTSTRDHKEETTDAEDDQKLHVAKGSIETIIEGESTILLDADGNFITAFMKEDSQSQMADPVRLSESSTATESVGLSQVSPTPVDSLPKPSVTSQASGEKFTEENRDEPLQSSRKEGSLNSSDPLSNLESGGSSFPENPVNEVYQSSDFSSRKVLSVNQQPPTAQPQKPASPEADTTPDTTAKPIDVSKSRSKEQLISYKVESLDDPLQEAGEGIEQAIVPDEQPVPSTESPDNMHEVQSESSTQSPEEMGEIPPPPTSRELSSNDDTVSQEDLSENTYHSRKINDEELYAKEEEELTKATPGFAKTIMNFVEGCAKAVVDRLPHSLQSLLEMEPIGLSPNMTVIATFLSFILLVIVSLTSGCSSQSGKKQKLKATLDVIQELEAKLQLAVKEKENIEDKIKESLIENTKLKEEISKQKKDSGKNNSELETIQLHSQSLEKQVATLEKELKELRENSNSKIGEAKQTSKRVKELDKTLKKIEEREKKLEQENHKLISDLRHKEEEVVSLTTKVGGLAEQIGHLETRKDQLLSEAEDWKEKVSDLNERLEQREEEFKQMQENIMFKDNELEVLKDCFLQLKSFEEEEAEDGEVREDGSLRVQEKLSSMMDVSKVNAALRAIEEDKDILANRLKIESEARKELEEQLENSRRSVESSMADKMKAERQCQEAQTKLTVLSNYFKEKELQLQRELGEQEALKKQNLNKLVSADETTRSFQQELEIVRTQNESLKRELASSERDFRSQIAANEKKAHENWLAARAAERELKEARHEAGVMRQKLTDIERRQFMGPGGLIRPLPTRGMPPPGMMNGPPPPGMDRSPSRGSLPPLPPPHLRDEDFMNSSRSPMELRRGPLPPPGMRPHPDARSPPLPPFRDGRSPPPRMPPPGMLDGRSPPPYDRRPPPPPHMLDRRSPPFRLPPPDMLPPPPMRGGPLPPPHFNRGSPSSGADSPHLDRPDGRYPPPYARNQPFPPDRPSPRGGAPPRQQQSQV